MLYDKPVWKLMQDCSADLGLGPFTSDEIVDWFNRKYPLVKRTTVTAHITGLTANDRNRHHYASMATKQPALFRVGPGRFESYDIERHGIWDDRGKPASRETSAAALEVDIGVPAHTDGADDAAASTGESSMEFALEAYLEEFLLTNWDRIDWGRSLALWEREGVSGNQYTTPIGRLDFLCTDTASGALVAIELKRGRPPDAVVGQIARYLGWLRHNLAEPDQEVEGIIVAQDIDDRLAYAAVTVPGLSILLYEVSFGLRSAGLSTT